jgi:hypothetical protein
MAQCAKSDSDYPTYDCIQEDDLIPFYDVPEAFQRMISKFSPEPPIITVVTSTIEGVYINPNLLERIRLVLILSKGFHS